jgi:hypothetical protein
MYVRSAIPCALHLNLLFKNRGGGPPPHLELLAPSRKNVKYLRYIDYWCSYHIQVSRSTSFLHWTLVLTKSNSSTRIYTTRMVNIGGYHLVKCDHPLFWISWLVTVLYPYMIRIASSSAAARSGAESTGYFLPSLRFHDFACSFTQTADSDKRFKRSKSAMRTMYGYSTVTDQDIQNRGW